MAFPASSFSPPPRSRRPQSAKTLFWQGLSDSPAMSPLAHHARPHRLQQPDRSCATSHQRSEAADCRLRNYRRGQPKTSCFSLRHKRRCSAAKPEDIGFAGGDPMSPPMSPLRAVVSRGHIASRNLNSDAHSRLVQSACVNRRLIVRLAARRQGYYGSWLPFLLDGARSAGGWRLRLHAGATSRPKEAR